MDGAAIFSPTFKRTPLASESLFMPLHKLRYFERTLDSVPDQTHSTLSPS